MDKYEYKARAEEIRRLVSEKRYREAVEIADTIDWRNVQNGSMLCTVSDLYKICRRFEDSRDVLLLAYQRNPKGRLIIYSLCELSIKLNDVVNAVEYYKEYLQVAPRDTGRYILQYKLYEAQEASLEERISILEELQKRECKPKWMYELAYLYHRVGFASSCVEECDQIFIFFGEGKYVVKALELKKLHEPLTEDQEMQYKRMVGHIEDNITIQDVNVSKYNTIDLQKELADNLKEVLGEDNAVVDTKDDTKVYGANADAVQQEPESFETKVIESVSEIKPEEPAEVPEEVPVQVSETESEEQVKETPNEDIQSEEIKNEEPLSEEAPVEEAAVEEPAEEIKAEEPAGEENIAAAAPEASFNDPDITEITSGTGDKPVSTQISFINDGKDVAIGDTAIYSREEIETALGGTKIVDPAEEYAEEKTGFEDMLSLEGDGQLSLVVPDQVKVEKQITGQLSIDEVLAEYERLRVENEKKWSDGISKRIRESTGDLLKNFDETSHDGLLEELEQSIENNPDSVAYGPNLTEEELIYLQDDEEIVEEDPTPEELHFDRTPYISVYDAPEPENNEQEKGPEPESIDNTAILTDEESDYLSRFAAATAEREAEDLKAVAAFEEAMSQIAAEENVEVPETDTSEDIVEIVPEEPEVAVEETETIAEEIEEKVPEEPITEEVIKEVPEEAITEEVIEEVSEEVITEETVEGTPEETVTEETVEEVPEETAAEENVEEAPEKTETEENVEETPEETVSEDKPENTSVNKVEGADDFTDDQWERFESFLQTESGREQIKEALKKLTDASNTGNVIIGSMDTDSAVELGKELIIEQSHKSAISGKAAKIKASSLNAKDAVETLSKVYDGAIIIQDAEDLRKETLDGINKVLSVPDKKMIVIMTVHHRQKLKFIEENAEFLDSFNISIDIDALDNTELVRLAKDYAYQREYSINDMGSLALHRRIDEKQTNSHCVTLKEVKDIVDEAISHASKKNMGHFFDIILGKRYDSNDMVVLGEKDFIQ